MESISLETLRLFVAIDLDEGARQAIGAEQQRLAKALDADRSLKWVNPAHIHLTLAFLGEIAGAAVPGIVEAISPDIDVRPFTAVFDGRGLFPPRGAPRVLWLDVREGAGAVVEVQRQVADRLDRAGVPLDPRPFQPHLTLARWRLSRRAEGLRALAADRHTAVARLSIDHVTLYHSRLSSAGPTYTALARANLI